MTGSDGAVVHEETRLAFCCPLRGGVESWDSSVSINVLIFLAPATATCVQSTSITDVYWQPGAFLPVRALGRIPPESCNWNGRDNSHQRWDCRLGHHSLNETLN